MRSVLDEAELLLIAVNPGRQGRNIGRTLLLDNIATAHSRNIHHIHLEVRETNKAIQLYRSAGFVQRNTRKGYYHGKDGEVFDAFSFVLDRKSVVWGKSVSVRVDLGGGRIIKKKMSKKQQTKQKKK